MRSQTCTCMAVTLKTSCFVASAIRPGLAENVSVNQYCIEFKNVHLTTRPGFSKRTLAARPGRAEP